MGDMDDKIAPLKNQLEQAKKVYLTKNGWVYESSYPGSYWMWSKEIPASGVDKVNWKTGTYVCNTETALKMQSAMDNWFSPDEEWIGA